jgi:glutamyl-tRNA reductase
MSHLTPEDRATIEKMSRAILKGLLHDPILSLKEGAEDRAFLESVRRLFGLPPGEEDVPI